VAPYVFMIPAAVMFIGFVLLPIGYAVVLSTRALRVQGFGIGRSEEVFVGLDNYRDALADPELWNGLQRLGVYALLVVPTMLGLALLFALLLDLPRVRFAGFSRMAIFLPYAVPGVVATLLWGFLYLPDVSPLVYVVRQLGGDGPDLLGPTSVFGAVANIAVWGGVGFNMIVLWTSLRAIPPELYDAARVDGCSEGQIAVRIKLPLLIPALVMTAIFSVIATLQVFSEPTTLQPLTTSISSSWVPLMKVYNDAFVTNDIHSAAATSLLLAAASLVLSLLVLRVLQTRAFGDSQ
jgi:multiple sugar transport system permease protein